MQGKMKEYVSKHLGADYYKNLKEAINGLYEKGYLSQEDRDQVRKLSFTDDKHLMAAWDTYLVMRDEEDFADTLQVLCDVTKGQGG